MTELLDANVLIALTVADHVHHDAAEEWFEVAAGSFVTCPLTEGALVRTWLRAGSTAADAVGVLASVTGSERHELWSDDQAYLLASASRELWTTQPFSTDCAAVRREASERRMLPACRDDTRRLFAVPPRPPRQPR